jgi:Uma2 family endonuclease
MPKPREKHNRLLHNLGEMLRRWVRHMKLGQICFDIDMILDDENDLVYAPDLMFLSTLHQDRLKDGRIFGLADVSIEILSPTERRARQGRKFADYEAYGIPWYWIIEANDEKPTLEEHQLLKGRCQCRTEVVGAQWFAPGVFPGLVFRLPPLLDGDLKAAVKGKAKRFM